MQVACEESDKQYAWLTWLHSFLWNKSGEETLGQWSVSFLPLKSWAYIVCLLAPQREEKGLFLAYLKFLASFLVLDRSGFIFLFLFFCFVFFASLYPLFYLSGGSEMSDDGEWAMDPLELLQHILQNQTSHLPSTCALVTGMCSLGSYNNFTLNHFCKTMSYSKSSHRAAVF